MTATTQVAPAIQELVLDAVNARTPLRIAGRSHWIDAGRPVAATRIASLAAHAGIVDYVPGDLTITVRSGTTLREISEAARAKGQWLPLDPFGTSDGTIGATIATGSFGPLANGFGRARDLVLGLEFVTGEGKIVRGGGRVVKNVAGFDLVRLVTGSWGTIGIVTEATLRLYALPGEQVTVAVALPDGTPAISARVTAVLSIPGAPFAVEMVDSGVAERIGLQRKPQILVRLGGNWAAVSAQRAAIDALGGVAEADPATWDRLHVVEDSMRDGTPSVIRISALPRKVPQIWNQTGQSVGKIDGAMMHATPALGIVRCILPSHAPLGIIEDIRAANAESTVIYERLPADAWPRLSPGVVNDRLSQRIKKAFDPAGILNPGILGPVT